MRWSGVVAVAVLLTACSGDSGSEPQNPEATFPKSFLWGTAVAGFQVDAGCPTLPAEACEDRSSDWYQWVTDPDLIAESATAVSGEPLSHAPGMWETYDADFARARDELHTGAIRLSLEWSRLFPDGAAEQATTVDALATYADSAAVAHYRAMFQAARDRGLTLLVTLNHYTLPLWIHDGKACHQDLASCEDRGWLDGDRILPAIGLYAGFCAKTFGDQVDLWATVNEPFGMVLAAYIFPSPERTNPPGLALHVPEGVTAIENLIRGNAAMYDAVHANDTVDADGDGVAAKVGPVKAVVAFAPQDAANPDDLIAVEHADYVMNRVFLNGVVKGELDHDLDGVADETLPSLAGRLDYLGINYYTRMQVQLLGGSIASGYALTDFMPDLENGLFNIYPEGLYEVVTAMATSYGKPIIITENGMLEPTDDAGETYLLPHLRALHRAMSEGHEVLGYFYWSLVDNYEWNHGMDFRLGLYALDIATKARTLRPVGVRYGEVVRARGF
ncbi:MAG: glycoside hydrolase family 1 protein [Deltaproteobacteria bacterium]|nr:MAG: glycoside hydrolase family 1 protein [Deltaproteobacteria bacterium]